MKKGPVIALAVVALALLTQAPRLAENWPDNADPPDQTDQVDQTDLEKEPALAPEVPEAAVPVPPAERQRVLDAIDNLGFTLRDFATANGGNPVGTNAEITASLLGDNPRQVKLTVPEGSSLNNSGELCDPWGSAWFFHQLSGSRMEIRSAGRDRTLYTDDDFVR